MPYTSEQLRLASTEWRYNSDSVNAGFATQIALHYLEHVERENCPVRDERTGEIIEGEPFVVESTIEYWIPAPRECHRYTWNGLVRESCIAEHFYADEDSAREDGCRQCERCGDWRYHDDLCDDVEIDGEWYCTYECAHENGWETCERCGTWVHEDDAVIIESGDFHIFCDAYCADMAGWTRCDNCDEWTYDTWTVGGEQWCESCTDYYSSICDECGDRVHENDIEFDEERDMYLCPDCRDDGCHHHHAPRAAECLHEYGWTPTLRFYTTDEDYNRYQRKQPLFLGVELETDGGNDRMQYVGRLANIPMFNDHFWMTKDSSLNDGVEITGHPMTLDYHEGLLVKVYEEISKAALEFGYRSHDGGRCGLHIHVNRNFFGQDERLQDAGGYKLMRLLQRFERLFTMFSRRESNRWCNYRTYYDGYELDDEVKVSRTNKREEGLLQVSSRMICDERAHAQCINFEHPYTFEFRIFRGTLKWTTYFACLAMVDGLCHAVKKHGSIWVESVCWLDLMSEVALSCTNPFAAECLNNYLDEKGLR